MAVSPPSTVRTALSLAYKKLRISGGAELTAASNRDVPR